jgi:hypothetical protein
MSLLVYDALMLIHSLEEKQMETPTKQDLLNNPEWVALFGEISRQVLERIAEDQADRAKRWANSI